MSKPKTPLAPSARGGESARLDAYGEERREAQYKRIARSMSRRIEVMAPAECDGEYEVLDR
jgi:hypothetical protein